MALEKPKISMSGIPKLKLDLISRNPKNQNQNCHTERLPSYDCLSYTFRANHDKIKNEKRNLSQYQYDLQKTFELSIQLIESITPTLQLKQDEKAKIKKKIKMIKELHQKKEQLNKDKAKIRSKLLVDNQICEEIKRRKEENMNYYQDQVDGFYENINKKTTFIKKFQKKFNEVEVFIQRESQESVKYKTLFRDFEILPFLYLNEKLLRDREEYYKLMKIVKNDIKIILKENVELKKREEFIDEDNDSESNKYSELIQLYKSKIQYFQSSNDHHKAFLRNLTSQIKMKNIQKNLLEAYQELEDNKNDNSDDNNHSLHLIQNNIKGSTDDVWNNMEHEEGTNKLSKKSNIVWDISCIEKTDDN